jgi:hypothetical protein
MAEPKLAFGLPQHPHEHRPKRPVLLAVDQELGDGAELSGPSSGLRTRSVEGGSRGLGSGGTETVAGRRFRGPQAAV